MFYALKKLGFLEPTVDTYATYKYIYIINYHNIPLYGTFFQGPFWLSLAVGRQFVEVEVRIESVDVDSGKMSLSMKQPE